MLKNRTKFDTVIILTDVYESCPQLDSKYRQEWESLDSIQYLINIIQKLGYKTIFLQPILEKSKLLSTLMEYRENSILFNLVEGFFSRNREGYVPSLAEFLDMPFVGSDSYSQNISLDKHLTKKIAQELGVPVSNWIYLKDNFNVDLIQNLNYPLFIKPNYEGSSLGITEKNIIQNQDELIEKSNELLKNYSYLLIEEYLPGKEFTVGVIGNKGGYSVTSVATITYPNKVYSEEVKTKSEMPEKLAFEELNTNSAIQNFALQICKRLEISGYARLDFKSDSLGNPKFLELNLTPGLSYKYSSFPILYQNSFGNYSKMIGRILNLAIEKYNSNQFRYSI